MGETKKKDQPTKRRRQLCGLGKSSSDSEIARSKGSVKERWPFPQSLTVDELARYRRRRVQGWPKDTLCRTEGSLSNIITEYRRAFRASSEDLSKRLEIPAFGTSKGLGPVGNLVVADAEKVMESRTESSRFIPHLNAPGRPPQLRRGTSLKRGGKFSSDTEQSSYVAHPGNHRAELARRPTSLKMEGEMSTRSENCDKFIEWLNVTRPEIVRLPSHLKLEGDIETLSENHEKYVPFVGARRPEILRQSANLRMEGESRYVPEYTEVFKDPNIRGKRSLKKPETHLRTEGHFYNTTETSEQFVNPRSILENDLRKSDTEDEDEDGNAAKMKENNETRIERLDGSYMSDVTGPTPLEIPEYRDAFKDFPRERPKMMRPGDEIGRSDGSKVLSSAVSTGSKFPTKIDMDPEYRSKFLDLSTKESPVYRKPPLALRPSGVPMSNFNLDQRTRRSRRSSSNEDPDVPQRARHFDTTEVRSQYVPYGNIPRVESVKMPANLQLEGNIDLLPEYRNAYCGNRNYNFANDQPRMHRRRERSSSESRRRDNYWTNTSQSDCENFRRQIYHKDDDAQDAFRILKTRVPNDGASVVGKPPSGSRRSSLINRPTSHVDVGNASQISRGRSPSPTYRLHVCNVDDEPRGFGRGKGQKQLPGEVGGSDNKNVDIDSYHRRSYSPSFGKKDPTKSFVVLPDHINNQTGREEPIKYGAPTTAEYRGRNRAPHPPGNYNAIDQSTGINYATRDQFRPRNKTPPNWMRPWYDNAAGD